MSAAPKILAFAGSAREGSWNKKIVRVAAEAARAAGGAVTLVDLRDFPMPIVDLDWEAREGIPESARRFKALMVANNGFLLSSPEHNSMIPAEVKNLIDWATRTEAGEKPLACFSGKVAGLLAASPGRLGGMRMLPQLRMLLSNLMVHVIPEQAAIPLVDKMVSPEGKVTDAAVEKQIETVAKALVRAAAKLKG